MLHFPLFTAIALSFAAPPTPAVDLEKINQPIRKEPAYQSKAPKYCLVVFGPKAETRVWVVLDGETLYVDKNGNGDLTEAGEHLKVTTPNQDPASFSEVEIETEGKTKPKLSAAVWGWLNRNQDPKREPEVTLSATVEDGTRFVAWGDEKSPLKFAARPAGAPIVHFGGPLVMGLEIRSPLARKSADTFELNMAVGCKGRGPGAGGFRRSRHVPDLRPPGRRLRRVGNPGTEASRPGSCGRRRDRRRHGRGGPMGEEHGLDWRDSSAARRGDSSTGTRRGVRSRVLSGHY